MSWERAKQDAADGIAKALGLPVASGGLTPGMRAVLQVLSGKRFPLEDEKATQAAIWAVLEADAGTWKAAREVPVAGGIIDFVVGGTTGIEVKLKGSGVAIGRQLRGYAMEPALTGLVLVTSKPVMVPRMMNGKPLAVVEMGRAWL